MKINLTDKTYSVSCPHCHELLEVENVVSSSDTAAAIVACGTWAGMHICYKRLLNIARETGNLSKKVLEE